MAGMSHNPGYFNAQSHTIFCTILSSLVFQPSCCIRSLVFTVGQRNIVSFLNEKKKALPWQTWHDDFIVFAYFEQPIERIGLEMGTLKRNKFLKMLSFCVLVIGLSCSTQKCIKLIKLHAINILKFNYLSITMLLPTFGGWILPLFVSSSICNQY